MIRSAAFRLAELRRAEGRWWMALTLYLAVGLFAVYRYGGPMPRTLASTGVSSSQALQTLDLLLGPEQKPHRAGSKENELVRVRLLGTLDQLGAQTRSFPVVPPPGRDPVKSGKLAPGDTLDAPILNIVARIDGQPRSRPVVLATHYDSCRFGPGAGDAGQCVAAVLEVLRVLKQQPLQHEVWCLFTDAEEFGLWGANSFVKEAFWGASKPIVINLDARGNRGAVLLYETHSNNLRAMQIAARGLAQPQVSTSLMAGVYKRLPNGTDFTEFLRDDWCGWNFAVVAGAEHYHTADDTLENLSPRSIQHFAAHAHSILRQLDQLSSQELDAIDQSEPAVFFDLLGWTLIVYPATWNWVHCILIGALWVIACRIRAQRLTRVILVMGAAIAILMLGAGIGMLISRLLVASTLLPRSFVPYGELWALVYPVSAAVIVGVSARLLTTLCSRSEIFSGLTLFLLLGGALVAWGLPGAAYLWLWPAFFLVLAWFMDDRRMLGERWDVRLGILACVVPAILYAPTYVLLAQTLGPRAGMVITAAVAFMLLPTLLAWADSEYRSTEGRQWKRWLTPRLVPPMAGP